MKAKQGETTCKVEMKRRYKLSLNEPHKSQKWDPKMNSIASTKSPRALKENFEENEQWWTLNKENKVDLDEGYVPASSNNNGISKRSEDIREKVKYWKPKSIKKPFQK